MSLIFNSTGYRYDCEDIVRAKGTKVFDRSGKSFIDFESGVWCLPLGHAHEAITEAIYEQAAAISHVGYRYTAAVVEEAAKALLEVAAFPEGKCVFLSSGSEAVEYAIQLAKSMRPGLNGIRFANYYVSAYGAGKIGNMDWITIDVESDIEMEAESIDFSTIGYMIIEPGNFSGSVRLFDRAKLHRLIAKVKANDGIIIVDEVTTGIGRMGYWFGYMHYGIIPDIIASGKGLGNGYPISAVIMTDTVSAQAERSTFRYAQSHQNDPLGCAVAKTVIETIRKNDYLLHANKMGVYLRQQLSMLQEKHGCLNDIRGIGLMNAVSFSSQVSTNMLDVMQNRLFEKGLLVAFRKADKTMRLYPPLIIEKKDIQLLVDGLEDTFTSLEL